MASYDSAGTYEEPIASLHDIFYSLPIYSPNSPSQGENYHGFNPFPGGEDESVSRTLNMTHDTNEEEAYDSYRWLSDWWRENCSSHGYVSCNSGYGKALDNIEDKYPTQEGDKSYETTCLPHYSSGLLSECGDREEEETYKYGWAEPAYSYSTYDMRLFEGIFGYWPCLSQRNHLNNHAEGISE